MNTNQSNLNEISKYLFKEYPDCVSVIQLQKMLGIKRTKAYELIKNKDIKAIKIGKDYKISKLNIISYLYGVDQI